MFFCRRRSNHCCAAAIRTRTSSAISEKSTAKNAAASSCLGVASCAAAAAGIGTGAKTGAAACTFGQSQPAKAGVKAAETGDAAATGIFNARATDLEASAKEQSNAATRAKRSLEEASELVRDCQDHAKKALDLYKEFTASHNQMQRAAIHRA